MIEEHMKPTSQAAKKWNDFATAGHEQELKMFSNYHIVVSKSQQRLLSSTENEDTNGASSTRDLVLCQQFAAYSDS